MMWPNSIKFTDTESDSHDKI